MLTLAVLAVMAALSGEGDVNASIRPVQVAPQAAPIDEPVRLEDIEVTGRPLDALIDTFVNEVAAPAHRRGLARWEGQVCVGTANRSGEAAHYMIDRVSTVADDIGLDVGAPGCSPNVLIVVADDADATTRALSENHRSMFRVGGSGMDRGRTAFEQFQTSDAPVRWWTVSAPVNSETGLIATRLPSECRNACSEVTDMAPGVLVAFASRLTTQIVDRILRTVVVVDVDQVANVSAQQLADYVSMVVFAQIDPQADTRDYASVLNVFDAPETADGLTQWDLAYLEGLYSAERNLRSPRGANNEIAASIQRAHSRLNDAEE